MNLEKIKTITENLLQKEGIEVVSVKTKFQYGMSILEIIVDGKNLDAGALGKYNEQINSLIDEYLPENYYLEVSTMGAIRPINSLQEAKKHINKYVLAVTDKEKIKGVLVKVTDEDVYIKVNLKGRFKDIQVPFKEINKFKLTVKF